MNIIANSYFSGAGLLDIGLQNAGIHIGQAYEIDKDACATYRKNHNHQLVEGDISHQLVLEQDSCDLMAFTYPCTKYSRIADIHDTRTGDELFLHALRHLAIARPEAYLVENVPGMRAFPIVMEAMTRMPDYYVQVFCPVKAETWLPQRRHRLIIIGTRKHFKIRPPENTRAISLTDILEKNPDVTLPSAIKNRMTGAYRDLPIISDPERGDIAPTCVAHYAKDKSTRLVKDKRFPMGVRPYSVREYARLQGIPDSFTFPGSNTAAYRQIGNGVPVQMAEWAGRELTRYFKQQRQAA
ncbi:DNA cytosine methyltransferase [Thalassolituus sp.]|uniref:DNA cytosine methyltransferase n=1 Tax=Thalassolituus sp. TaxID=2030822 RepID=UPI00262A4548|nr:DNA cytosine methyltransferase [Thalassolituus sp.]